MVKQFSPEWKAQTAEAGRLLGLGNQCTDGHQAIHYYTTAASIYQSIGYTGGLARAYQSIGGAHKAYFGDLETALKYYELAYETFGPGGQLGSALESKIAETKQLIKERSMGL